MQRSWVDSVPVVFKEWQRGQCDLRGSRGVGDAAQEGSRPRQHRALQAITRMLAFTLCDVEPWERIYHYSEIIDNADI